MFTYWTAVCRYLFALQVKRDLSTGMLPCHEHTAILLASYVVQCLYHYFHVYAFVLQYRFEYKLVLLNLHSWSLQQEHLEVFENFYANIDAIVYWLAHSTSDCEVVGSSPASCRMLRSNHGPVALCTLGQG